MFHDLDAWRGVPAAVETLYAAWGDDLRAALASRPDDAEFGWDPRTKRAAPGPAPEGWVSVKRAALLGPVVDAFDAGQRFLGGPNPMASTIVGGLVGGGLGYAGGALAEQLLPEEDFRRGRLRRTLGVLGAGAGAVPGLAWARVNAKNRPEVGPGPLAPWLSGWAGPTAKAARDNPENYAGGLYEPTIPHDAFNAVVWSDALSPPSRFGTKSPWGTDEQHLGTPPPVAAAVSGIVAGAAAATGGESVSPWQIGVAAAATAGVGYAAGVAFGRTLGVLAGMTPEAQGRMRSIGLWGGMLTGAVGRLFGGG